MRHILRLYLGTKTLNKCFVGVLHIFCFYLYFLTTAFAQNNAAVVKGIVLDENSNPLRAAAITYLDDLGIKHGGQSDEYGVYKIDIPFDQDITLKIDYLNHKPVELLLNLKRGEIYEFYPVLSKDTYQIGEVKISITKRKQRKKQVQGVKTLSKKIIKNLPQLNNSVEHLLKTYPGFMNNNELSTQYTVRGGNYDENLVYVNGIEIYRPFLVRSGQQEGLSFVNTDMVKEVDFSAGGFQAKYGDKLSSVLDVTYRTPDSLEFGGNLSLLGGSLYVQGVGLEDPKTKKNKLTGQLGIRYRDNSLLVDSQTTEVDFKPRFADVQAYLSYRINKRLQFDFLGNISLNQYNYKPLTDFVTFGPLGDVKALQVFYQGQERDQFFSKLGAFKLVDKVNSSLTLEYIASLYHTHEREYYDIIASYGLGTVINSIGTSSVNEESIFFNGVGAQLIHARNDLDALIFRAQHRGTYKSEESSNNEVIQWGASYTMESIRDRLSEYEVIDSAGYSVRPLIDDFLRDEPYNSFTAPIVTFNKVSAYNNTYIHRLSAYTQYSFDKDIGKQAKHTLSSVIGVRTQAWMLYDKLQAIVSPRFHFGLDPDWENQFGEDRDFIFNLSFGLYNQAPFYRELRDINGVVSPDVLAQKSFHAVFGMDYNFVSEGQPFSLTTELYYKYLWDVNPYSIDNVRIRYAAHNEGVAFARGIDLRLHGEFVKGSESWFTFGVMDTQENIMDRGYIARPTDQRLKFGVLFQDYVPTVQNLKMYLNLVYQTGVLSGTPNFEDSYQYRVRLRPYRRADIGLFYVFKDDKNNTKFFKNTFLDSFKSFSVGLEVFNVFNTLNVITNTYVRDISSKTQFLVPNYMTSRVVNFKMYFSL